MLRKLLLTSLAVAGAVNGQRDPCDAKSTTVNSDADIAALAGCPTLAGDLILGPNVVLMTLNGIARIRGSLIVSNVLGLQTLIAPSLTAIESTFNLTGLTALASLQFPQLRSVGELYWQTLPALTSLQFDRQVTEADRVTITDTALEALTGINLVTVERFDINNNKYLKEVEVQLTNITDSLAIEFNSPSVVASFPNLTWANNATFRSCGEIDLPSLVAVNGSIGFFENTFTNFSAPKLTGVGIGTSGGDVTFANNDELTAISMPQLNTIHGTLQIVNDSSIDAVDGFPKLSVLYGSIDISGEFKEASFPALKDVRGGLNLQTTEEFNCDSFDKLKGGAVKGTYLCQGAVVNPGTEGTTPTTTGGGSGSTGKPNAAGRLSTTNSFAAIPALALFAALFL